MEFLARCKTNSNFGEWIGPIKSGGSPEKKGNTEYFKIKLTLVFQPKRKADKKSALPQAPKKAKTPLPEIQVVSNRMEHLTSAAKHIATVNHPERVIDMALVQDNNLDVIPTELPVLKQLIRDVQAAESDESEAEDLPKKDATPPVAQPETDATTSPVSKRSKVVVQPSAHNSPIIHSKRPDRSMEVTPSPLTSLRGKSIPEKEALVKYFSWSFWASIKTKHPIKRIPTGQI